MERLTVTFWDRHPEVAAFVTNHLGVVPQTEIRKRIVARFGAEKTPSSSALNRFAVEWKILHQKRVNGRRSRRLQAPFNDA